MLYTQSNHIHTLNYLIASPLMDTTTINKKFEAELIPMVDGVKLERRAEREAQLIGRSLYSYMDTCEQQNARLTVDFDGIYRNVEGKSVTGTFLYVVLEDSSIIHVPDKPDNNGFSYRHSCLANGKKVYAAGKLYLEEGRLLMVSNESGHYKPSGEKMRFMLDNFLDNSKNEELIFQDHTNAADGFAYEYSAQVYNQKQYQILKVIEVNNFTDKVVDEDHYITEGNKSRFDKTPRLINNNNSFIKQHHGSIESTNYPNNIHDQVNELYIDTVSTVKENKGRYCTCELF